MDKITNETNIMKGDAQAIADIVRKHVAAELVDVSSLPRGLGEATNRPRGLGPNGSDEVPVLVLPSGLQAHSVKRFLDEYRTAPERRSGTAHLVELESFIAHVNRFKDDDSAIFAKPAPTQPELVAVFDYHRRCNLPPDDGDVVVTHVEGAPRFGGHRAKYTFPLSDEWNAWTSKDGQPMAQGEFAAWLEDRIVDVADPDAAFSSAKRFAAALGIPGFAPPSKLLQLSRGLSVHVDERAATKLDPSTGETTVFYSAEHKDEAGAPLSVPRAFLIVVRVFRQGALYQLPVRLKYRLSAGRLTWHYEIHDMRKAFDDAFREACEVAAERSSLPLFYGSPEA